MKLGNLLLVQLFLLVAAGYGWITNILVVVHSFQSNLPFDPMLILRCVGIPLAPLGVVLGYI
jgi:hypothetical protein